MNKGYAPLIAVLAGGRSRRMGTDKARLPVQGTTWLAHIVQTALQTPCRVAVVGRAKAQDDLPPEVPLLTDVTPGLGPMGGLLTALRHAGGPVVAVGCDMPLLTEAAFAWLLDEAAAPGPLGLGVRSDGGLEPLFSYYAAACLPLLEARVEARQLALQRVLVLPGFRIIPAPAWVNETLRNINTPDERRRFGL